ncbi:VWA domain-containing protein [Collinsella provencensis]|uniref:VWA domain-containing protein n=1 Tax=Collinsella provencensis TaxID=1937461 RepID=UPI000C81CB8C|nr:VWA domain-containing protein [Collinsella provencensis]
MKTNLFRKKGLIRAFTAVMTSVFLAMVFVATPAMGATADIWNISKSKTATNLDENYESQVTLSLPSAEEELVSDIVFVMDESSCNDQQGSGGPGNAPLIRAKVTAMLNDLNESIAKSGATIQVGVVQFRGEVTTFPLTELDASTGEKVANFMNTRPTVGGSNMSAGLNAGKAMLDNDTRVKEPSRKYLIVVSDGLTYIWDDEDTKDVYENYGVNFANGDAPNKPMLASPDGWDVRYYNGYTPDDWNEWYAEMNGGLAKKTIDEKPSTYDRDADISGDKFVHYGEKDNYASTVDVALYKSYQVYQSIKAEGYNAYVVCEGVPGEMASFPYGPSFMKWMGGENTVDFDDIQKDVYYLLDSGSKVVDVMGKGTDDKGNAYDFDFVNDVEKLELEVGDQVLDRVKIDENTYGFGKTDNGFRFKVTYCPEGTPEVPGEHFVWEINEAVSNFDPVALTYTVKLMNPQTKAGTYGEYDANGAAGKSALYTNDSATLYPVDTNQTPGAAEDFAKPTVSYTVAEAPVVPEEPAKPEQPEKPAKPEQPEKPAKPTKKPSGTLPQTGDAVMAAVVLTGLVGAGAGVAYVSRRRA